MENLKDTEIVINKDTLAKLGIKYKKNIFSNRKRQYGRDMFKISYRNYLKKHKLDKLNDVTTSDFILTDLEFEKFLKFEEYEDNSNYGFLVGDIIKIKSYYLCAYHETFNIFEMEILKIDNSRNTGLAYLKINTTKLEKKLRNKLDSVIKMYPNDFTVVNDDVMFSFNNCILSDCILIKSII